MLHDTVLKTMKSLILREQILQIRRREVGRGCPEMILVVTLALTPVLSPARGRKRSPRPGKIPLWIRKTVSRIIKAMSKLSPLLGERVRVRADVHPFIPTPFNPPRTDSRSAIVRSPIAVQIDFSGDTRPHPGPLPRGEGESFPASWKIPERD